MNFAVKLPAKDQDFLRSVEGNTNHAVLNSRNAQFDGIADVDRLADLASEVDHAGYFTDNLKLAFSPVLVIPAFLPSALIFFVAVADEQQSALATAR